MSTILAFGAAAWALPSTASMVTRTPLRSRAGSVCESGPVSPLRVLFWLSGLAGLSHRASTVANLASLPPMLMVTRVVFSSR
jgi:hypothetical protein